MIQYGNYWLASNSSGGVVLSSNLTTWCYWSFMKADKGDAGYYSTKGLNSSSRWQPYNEIMTQIGYTAKNNHCVSAATAYDNLGSTDEIFVFWGHGVQNANRVFISTIKFEDLNGDTNGYISTALVRDNDDDRAILDFYDNQLANARCVLFLSCGSGTTYTVDGKSYNLVDAVYAKGAHFVLGFEGSIAADIPIIFLDEFLERCADESIGDIVSDLDASSLYDLYFVGDTSQYLSIN